MLVLTVTSLYYYKDFSYKTFKVFIPFYLLYLLYAIGYYRDNFEIVNLMFERKAIVLALPLVFSITSIDTINYKLILKYFVYGCIVAYLLSLIIGFYNSFSFNPLSFDTTLASHKSNELVNPNASPLLTNNFLSVNFTLDMNPTALAMYFSMSLAILYTVKELFTKKQKYLFSVLLILGVLQLASVLGILMLIFVVFSLIKPSLKKPMIITVVSGFILFLGVVSQKEKQSYFDSEKLEKIDSRVLIWHTALNSIDSSNFFFGNGVKNAQKLLDKNYPKEGEFGFAAQIKKLDSHNMYLQFILEIGVVGLIVYLISIFVFFKQIKTMNNFSKNLSIIFIGLILFFNITECAFNIYIGISFFTFFYVLAVAYKHHEQSLSQ
ncbi:O-antigen ligase family protein [Lacinutrix salivirga]